ncbi:hypothetical protein Mgra_00005231 [Meloidogyne graminicola]|uniref:Peptidase M13 C-terminal domain-containing protein n=1 Tax=Meloidogyne graminicola TaxID=189291 RepID=A0A8S9ZQF9_9BILA|nr:hypothetical protein Mgra_00005231 [Meloidogyne graminicola]
MAKIINETDKHYDNVYADDKYLILKEFQNTLAATINWARYLQNTFPRQVLLQKFPDGVANVEVRISEVTLIKELDRVLQGSTERAAKWKECKNVLVTVFPAIIERVNATKVQLEEMFQNVKKEFHLMLDQNGVEIFKTLKKIFKIQLRTLKVLIGYMDSIFNETKLEKLYSEFSILPGQPFHEAMTLLNIFINQKAMLQLLELVEVEFSSLGINGFYYPIKNVIVLTGGILQGVFFNSSTRPISMNYGSIGVVLAHEITHGFDNNGRLHDEFGNVRNWWKKETAEAFQNQKHCFIDQYDAITVEGLHGLHINGNMTQGENIADNGGMRAAYNAMKRALEENPMAAQQKIAGMEEFSAEQLFFINYAFSWCTNQRPEAAIFGAVYDVHSPPEARVNVVLANMEQFSSHFNCPLGTVMNPKKRCKVW